MKYKLLLLTNRRILFYQSRYEASYIRNGKGHLQFLRKLQFFAGFTAASSLDTIVKGSADLTQMMKQVSQMDDVNRPCIREFFKGCAYCVQLDSPFCDEGDPYFNGFMCTLQINKSLISWTKSLIFQKRKRSFMVQTEKN